MGGRTRPSPRRAGLPYPRHTTATLPAPFGLPTRPPSPAQAGWCEGVVQQRNESSGKKFKVDGEFVNFLVYYEADKNLSSHVLKTDGYAWGADAAPGSWVLLTKA